MPTGASARSKNRKALNADHHQAVTKTKTSATEWIEIHQQGRHSDAAPINTIDKVFAESADQASRDGAAICRCSHPAARARSQLVGAADQAERARR